MPLTVNVPATEIWHEDTEEFECTPGYTFEIEHCLYAIRKWEGIWKKSFLNAKELTRVEYLSYVRAMTITKDVPDDAYRYLTPENKRLIDAYMAESMTATTITRKNSKSPSTRIITAEVIYYHMVEFGIPFECEHWPLSTLMTLISVCAEKSGGGKKMSERDILSRNASLNAMRRASLGTRG